jgi:GNAT superfamily N-acetyltransferase
LGAAFRAALPHVPLVDAEALIGRSRSSDGVHLTRAEHFVLGKAMAKAVLGSLIAVGRAPNSDEYRAHLQQLSSDCCRLRFNGGMSEGNIASVVDQARNAHLIGLRCGRRLIGVAELHPIGTKMVEMALSIEEPFRGRGYGTLLFSTALDHMRARAIRRVCFLCQTNNTPMRKLLEKFRARQMREDNEIAAWIDLPAR